MYCYYSHGHNAYLKILPYKVEIVSLEPKIEIYHEVLSNDEIETVKELATPRVRILLFDRKPIVQKSLKIKYFKMC